MLSQDLLRDLHCVPRCMHMVSRQSVKLPHFDVGQVLPSACLALAVPLTQAFDASSGTEIYCQSRPAPAMSPESSEPKAKTSSGLDLGGHSRRPGVRPHPRKISEWPKDGTPLTPWPSHLLKHPFQD